MNEIRQQAETYPKWKAEAEEERDEIVRADDAAVIRLSLHVTLPL